MVVLVDFTTSHMHLHHVATWWDARTIAVPISWSFCFERDDMRLDNYTRKSTKAHCLAQSCVRGPFLAQGWNRLDTGEQGRSCNC
eukprot:2968718-Amphidinium_carterae.1